MATTSSSRASMLSVFRNRDFTFLWSGETISQFGTGITGIASAILVFRETGSAASVGLMLMATALPSLFFGLVAGVFVDRYDRKKIMLVSKIVRAGIVLSVPFLLPFGIWWLYVLVMLSSTVKQFFEPANASVLPDVASEEELAAANSFLSASQMGALGLGFAAAGLIAGRLEIEWAFYIDALTFLASAFAIWRVKLPLIEVDEESSVAAVVQNLKAGARFLFDTPTLRSAFIVTVPMAILFGFHNSLLLPFADRG